MSHADWDRLTYYSQKVKIFSFIDTDEPQVHPSTYLRIAQLQSSALFPTLRHVHYTLRNKPISNAHIFFFLSPLLDSISLDNIEGFENSVVGPFLAGLSESAQMLSRIVLRNGEMSVDTVKTSIVHFKQLRSLELSDAVFMTDFALWEVLGTLPSLTNLTLAIKPNQHPSESHDSAHPENSNGRSGDSKYFYALENLCVKGSCFLIHHLLSSIDSPCLKSIEVYPEIDFHEKLVPEDLFAPLTIVTSKWSHSLNKLVIGACRWSNGNANPYAISKFLMLFTVLHEIQTFRLMGLRMGLGNMNDDVGRLVKSWPKLRILRLPFTEPFMISLSTLMIIAENCPKLRRLTIGLDISTIPPFDTSRRSPCNKLEDFSVGSLKARSSDTTTQTKLGYQIQVAQHLDFIFPYLKSAQMLPKDEIWLAILDLLRLCKNARRVKQE